jgi:hypothetical protein
LIKFEEVYGRSYRGALSQFEAAEVQGMSERTFRRYRDRFDAEGAEGLHDRCLGRASARQFRYLISPGTAAILCSLFVHDDFFGKINYI